MGAKRSDNSLWKILVSDKDKPAELLDGVIQRYKARSRSQPNKYRPLESIPLQQPVDDVTLSLYVRSRVSLGLFPFVADYLESDDDKRKFLGDGVDACLFIATRSSLFAVTSGSAAYHIIEDDVDYAFPFDTAKKLIANSFTAATAREFAGPRTGTTETYRRKYSIANSESFGKVWKHLRARLDASLLPEDSYLRTIVDTDKPPAIDVRSSFVLKKRLDLIQLVSLAQELEKLPAAPPEQLRQLSFLDNLYVVRSRPLIEKLWQQIVENLRRMTVDTAEVFDLDVGDPDDLTRYYAGNNFRLSDWPLEGEPPQTEDVLAALREHCTDHLGDPKVFRARVNALLLSYSVDPDEDTAIIRKNLAKCLHGQVDLDGTTYFLLDKVWYESRGSFLNNLKKDFIDEVFAADNPILLAENVGFTAWVDKDEGTYNERQSKEKEFYYGDKIFALTDGGKVELFDLLKVDRAHETLYVIHVKDGFDGKMRDACSQIATSADVIGRDVKTGKVTLRKYYTVWKSHEMNADLDVTEEDFLSWFDLKQIVYVVLASTRTSFDRRTFESSILKSHIARREVIVTRNEFRGYGRIFNLAHVRRG